MDDVLKYLYGTILMLDLPVSVIVLNLLVNFFQFVRGSLDPFLKHRPFLLVVFYTFGRLFISFGKSDCSDFFKAHKFSKACEKFPGPFEHTLLYRKVFRQVNLTRNWARNALVILFVGKPLIPSFHGQRS